MPGPLCYSSRRPRGWLPPRNGKPPPVRCDARLKWVYLAFGTQSVCVAAVRAPLRPAASAPSALAIVPSLKSGQSSARQESAVRPPAFAPTLDPLAAPPPPPPPHAILSPPPSPRSVTTTS